jgi:16S rRNA (cytosine967-C5)-methyltransferase
MPRRAFWFSMNRQIRPNIPVSPARQAAYQILLRVDEGAYASALVATLPQADLSRQDMGLAQQIVLGVLRWQGQLDYFIEKYSRRLITSLDLPVLVALRMGLYQLRFLSRVPASAAVNESDNLVKKARLKSAAPLVNGVLRNAARNAADLPGADIPDPVTRLSIELSHPAWMLERWSRSFGQSAARALALANNEVPSIAFRVNTLLCSPAQALEALADDGLRVSPSSLVPGAFLAEQGAGLAGSSAAKQGLIYIQSEGSQLISLLVQAGPGDRILDVCAAPGSKTTHLAALTDNKAWIAACDVHLNRATALAATCRRLGATCVDSFVADAAAGLPFTEGSAKFDRVLVDAPCSGTGTLRENPEIKWRLTPEDPPRLAELQFALLNRAAEAVKPGGRLVYSTCSLEPEENEALIARFLATTPAFNLTPLKATDFLPQSLTPTASDLPEVSSDGLTISPITADGFIRTFPSIQGTDGFFAAILERRI